MAFARRLATVSPTLCSLAVSSGRSTRSPPHRTRRSDSSAYTAAVAARAPPGDGATVDTKRQPHASPRRRLNFSETQKKRAPPANRVGMLQSANAIHPLATVTYHAVVPLGGFFALLGEPPLHVSSEEELRHCLTGAAGFTTDGVVDIVLTADVQLRNGPLDVGRPLRIRGAPMADGAVPGGHRSPTLSVRGATALMITTSALVLEDVSLVQTEAPVNTFMCGLQVDLGGHATLRRVTIVASGSALRLRLKSHAIVEDSSLYGITSICTDDEDGLLRTQNNALYYYGEW